ncbi:tannase and feruloyl esterase [Glonium stellatum]|uniref:Carboxylic ester hydrolase n=1 Tax=Glonium stellatum TaxID=574774 RepID=A0A8E2JYQ0_9PEZI|nr:tannase and feruloyl esterase [Glonium stellatum]
MAITTLGIASGIGDLHQIPIGKACRSIHKPNVPGVHVLSITGIERYNVTIFPGVLLPYPISGLEFCDVEVIISHPGIDDQVRITVWLPLKDWNSRFQATGGGGFATGIFEPMLAKALEAGYAAAATDGGHVLDAVDPSSWALKNDGSVNWELLRNFASRSLHDMAIVGKAVTTDFYSTKPRYSYWNGCSTGGRQGYMIAQKYPNDFDGILANAPAIYWSSLDPSGIWPHIVMHEYNTFPSLCEYEYFVSAALAECDMLDGVQDGVILDPLSCPFEPHSLVGSTITCSNKSISITAVTASIVQKILSGPQSSSGASLWPGPTLGTPLHSLANPKVPFPISANWIRYFVLKQPQFNISSITGPDFAWLFAQSMAEYGWIMDAADPNLSSFCAGGGKLLTWHGTADPLITIANTLRYRERVEAEMGGASAVDKFYRLFLAPGVGHCGDGKGPVPVDALEKLVKWVEEGKEPESLWAETVDGDGNLINRDLCKYPAKLKWTGKGDWKLSESWTCESYETQMAGRLAMGKPTTWEIFHASILKEKFFGFVKGYF